MSIMLNLPKYIEKTVNMVYDTGRYLYTRHDCALFCGNDNDLRRFAQNRSRVFGDKHGDLPTKTLQDGTISQHTQIAVRAREKSARSEISV